MGADRAASAEERCDAHRLVYDLRDDYRALGYSEEEIAEFDSVETIDQLAAALEALGCEVDRVGRGQALAARLVAGDRFDLVFSIAEGLRGRSREAQVPALLRAVRPALSLLRPADDGRVASTRPWPSVLVRDCGRADAALRRGADERERARRLGPFPRLRQAARRGHRQGLRGGLAGALAARARSGVRRALLTRYPPAGAGRDLTCQAASSPSASSAMAPMRDVLGVCEILLEEQAEANVYSLHNKELCEELVIYARPTTRRRGSPANVRACRLPRASSAGTRRASTSAPMR